MVRRAIALQGPGQKRGSQQMGSGSCSYGPPRVGDWRGQEQLAKGSSSLICAVPQRLSVLSRPCDSSPVNQHEERETQFGGLNLHCQGGQVQVNLCFRLLWLGALRCCRDAQSCSSVSSLKALLALEWLPRSRPLPLSTLPVRPIIQLQHHLLLFFPALKIAKMSSLIAESPLRRSCSVQILFIGDFVLNTFTQCFPSVKGIALWVVTVSRRSLLLLHIHLSVLCIN